MNYPKHPLVREWDIGTRPDDGTADTSLYSAIVYPQGAQPVQGASSGGQQQQEKQPDHDLRRLHAMLQQQQQ